MSINQQPELTICRDSAATRRYAVTITQEDSTGSSVCSHPMALQRIWLYYKLDRFPELVAAAPKACSHRNCLVENIDGDSASGTQPLCFIDGSTHDMRSATTATPTPHRDGWRLKTGHDVIRRSGVHDSGRRTPSPPTP